MLKRKPPFWLGLLYACIVIVACYAAFNFYTIHRYYDGLKETPLNQYQGPESSKKVIVEFVDYRCSHCRNLHPVVKQVMARNPDVKVVYRHYPVFGKQSLLEAQIALAAGMQGKFSEAHNLLITREVPVAEAETELIARRLGLNIEKFMTDLKGPEIGNYLLYNLDALQRLGINSTPTFIMDNIIFQPLIEDPTPEMFEAVLNQAYGS